MSWIATAIIGSAVIGAVASGSAASTEAGAEENAAGTQQNMFNTVVQQEQPFLTGGYGAETTLNQLLGTSPGTGAGGTAAGTNLPAGYLTQTFNPTQAQLENYPGYKFQLQQGDLGLQNANSSDESALGGSTIKQLMGFNQGLAASNYNQYFNQFETQQNNIFSRLQNIASMGQNSAGNLGSVGATLGTGIAQAQAAAGAAEAGGIVGAGNSLGGSLTLAGLMNSPSFNPNSLAGNPYAGGATYQAPGYDPGLMGAGGGYVQNIPGYTSDAAAKDVIGPFRFKEQAGLMEYEFRYKGESKVRRGYLAQEVEKLYPEAVYRGPDGYLMVDYSKVPGWDELDRLNLRGFDA
jgi:hypothetical protein